MANPEHVAILKQGVEVWNEWRKENPDVTPELCDANLAGAAMAGVDLRRSNLQCANLNGAHLGEAHFFMANLSKAKLNGADLGEANLGAADLVRADLSAAKLWMAVLAGADLSGACLCKANLQWANLDGATVSGADFTESTMWGTHVADLDLSEAVGLDTVVHKRPSTVGIDTVYRSQGNIDTIFLRGCGVPDDMIAYIKSIAGAIQFYSCFISYSTKDQAFADRLYADLQARGVRCWFAPHDIAAGKKIHEQLDEAIRMHDKLLLILSEHSMASDWVQTEIAKARKREASEGKRMLFPVALVPYEAIKEWECFDADRGKDSAREVREYFIPDFSNWKDHDSYQKALQELERGLKAG